MSKDLVACTAQQATNTFTARDPGITTRVVMVHRESALLTVSPLAQRALTSLCLIQGVVHFRGQLIRPEYVRLAAG